MICPLLVHVKIACDGSTEDFFPQSFTDGAVAAAIADNGLAEQVEPSATDVDIILTDGTSKKFVPFVIGTA